MSTGLSDPRLIFGIHSVTCYSRSTGLPYGPELRVLEGSSVNISATVVGLQGGSSKFEWAAEDGFMKSEMDLKTDEFPDFMFTLFLGTAPTAVSTPDTAGTLSTAVNKQGSSIIAATGLIQPIVKTASKADLKFGKVVLKAADATHVDVYLLSDVDASRGNALNFVDDNHKVTVTPLAVSTGATVDIPNLGITLTGGASATAFVAGDTATFEILPPSSKSMSVVLGSQTASFPEFGALILAQKRGSSSYSAIGVSTAVTGEMFELDAFRCKGAGFPLDFNKAAWAKNSVKAQLLYDSVQNGIAKIRTISPS